MRLARPRVVLVLAIALGILLYAGFNVWVFRLGKRGAAPSPAPKQQTVTTSGNGFPNVTPASALLLPASSPMPTPTPTPRPTGPGVYACDPYGVCNKYSKEVRKAYCTVTYADDRCLDQCADKEKQCTK